MKKIDANLLISMMFETPKAGLPTLILEAIHN